VASALLVAACGSASPKAATGATTTTGVPGLSTTSASTAATSRATTTPAEATTTTSTTGGPTTVASTTAPPTTGAAACSDAEVVGHWSLARRAALLVVVPVFDYDMQVVRNETAVGVGGVIFLGDGSTPSDLASRLQANRSPQDPAPAPLVMTDEEGGGIQRLAGQVSSFPYAREIAATRTPAQTQALATSVGQQMRRLGVTVDLAPVLDVDGGTGPNRIDADGSRSFSDVPATASTYGVAFMRGLRAGGVLAVVKHFPGLGGTYGNTDVGPASTPPIATLRVRGLVPFAAAIAAGAPAVMTSNAKVPGVTTLPASLSSAVIGGLLEQQLGFRGLVVTDSLSAGAISAAGFDVPHASAAAVEAGADLILFGSTLDAEQTALLTPGNVSRTTASIVDTIVAAVGSGALSPARLDDADEHVIAAMGAHLCPSG
jgi:beta-N-acetylhexosaminidase